MKRKMMSLILSLTLIVTGVLSTAAVSWGWSVGQGGDYTGKDCTSNLTASSTIDYLMSKYKDGSTWTLGGECWGYAEKINEFLASASDTRDYTGLKNTQKNFLDKCRGVMAGTHIRFSNKKSFDGGWSGHSVVLLKVTDEQVYWTDNNYDRANTVRYYAGTVDDFYMLYGQYQYITRIKTTTKYKTYGTTKVSSRSNYEEGHIKLTWLRTTNTTKYEVLRSYTKNGTYRRIGTTTARTFSDTTAEIGRTAYYKIRSVKKSGNKTSGRVYNTLKLAAPVISVTNSESGKLTVSWNQVSRADRYKVYRSIDGGKEKLIKTTTALSYTDTASGGDGVSYTYRVKAVYDANSKGNSAYSAAVSGSKAIATPGGFSAKADGDNYVTLTWNPVAGADLYYLYCCREADGEYWIEAVTEDTSYFDTVRLPGQQYYYKIAAYDWETDTLSGLSGWILI